MISLYGRWKQKKYLKQKNLAGDWMLGGLGSLLLAGAERLRNVKQLDIHCPNGSKWLDFGLLVQMVILDHSSLCPVLWTKKRRNDMLLVCWFREIPNLGWIGFPILVVLWVLLIKWKKICPLKWPWAKSCGPKVELLPFLCWLKRKKEHDIPRTWLVCPYSRERVSFAPTTKTPASSKKRMRDSTWAVTPAQNQHPKKISRKQHPKKSVITNNSHQHKSPLIPGPF